MITRINRRHNLCLIFCLLLTNFKLINCSKSKHDFQYIKSNSSILLDIPEKTDLSRYLEVIDDVLKYYTRNKNEVDLSVYFGLFLSDVNLKYSLKNENLLQTSTSLHYLLNDYVNRNERLLYFFLGRVEKDHNQSNEMDKKILTLFVNEKEWLHAIESFNDSKVLEVSAEENRNSIFSNWGQYFQKVNHYEDGIPDPDMSDKCMVSLSLNPSHYNTNAVCGVDEYCYDMLRNGTDFGYAITHRLLLLLFARYGRGCSIFSTEEDQYYRQKFCSISYIEAEYIVNHNFRLVDLLLETMCLCALDGNTQFLRRSWLERIADFQTKAGCFGQTIKNVRESKYRRHKRVTKWKLNRGDESSESGICDGHVTSLAIATYSLAVRFILEHYMF